MGKPKAPPKQASNESRAVLRSLRVSPQKLNLVAQSIRGLSAETLTKEDSRFAEILPEVRAAGASSLGGYSSMRFPSGPFRSR